MSALRPETWAHGDMRSRLGAHLDGVMLPGGASEES